MDNRTKHKPMSEASEQFTKSILAGNGIQTAVEFPIREAGSLDDPPQSFHGKLLIRTAKSGIKVNMPVRLE